MEAASTRDPMMEALLKDLPTELAEEARAIRDLFLVSGCPRAEAQRKVVELYNRMLHNCHQSDLVQCCWFLARHDTFRDYTCVTKWHRLLVRHHLLLHPQMNGKPSNGL